MTDDWSIYVRVKEDRQDSFSEAIRAVNKDEVARVWLRIELKDGGEEIIDVTWLVGSYAMKTN